jgi:hypothetical protein
MSIESQQREGAKDLVERARLGDQNAMAILEEMGKNARNGNAKARSAYSIVMEYIRRNPVETVIGVEESNVLGVLKDPANPIDQLLSALTKIPALGSQNLINVACVILADTTPWNDQNCATADKCLNGAPQSLFRYGFTFSNRGASIQQVVDTMPEAVGFLCAGHCIGTARKIQMIRHRNAPLVILSPDIGWELG